MSADGRPSDERRARSAADAMRTVTAMLDLSPRRVVAAVAAATATLGAAFALAAVSGWLITTAWTRPPVLDLTVAVVSVRALGISRGVFRWIERMTTHDTALRGVVSLRTAMVARLASSRSDSLARLSRGQLLTRLGDDAQELAQHVIRSVVPAITAAVMAVLVLTIIIPLSLAAGLAMLAGLAIASLAAPWLAHRAAMDTGEAVVRQRGALTAQSLRILDDASALRIDGSLDQALGELAELQRDADRALDRASAPAAWASAAVPLAMAVAALGSALAAGPALLHGHASAGVIGVLLLVPLSAFEAAMELPAAAAQLARTRAASARIAEAVAGAPAPGADPADGGDRLPAAGPTHLTARTLTAGWAPGDARVSGLDLDLPPGSRLVVVGPSGTGKSTLLRTLAGLLEPLDGQVVLDGRDIAAMPAPEVRARIVHHAEDAHVFATSVRENVRVARGDASDEEILTALDGAGLGAWIASLPGGLDHLLGPDGTTVSGGERRRLLLARALVRAAPISLVDEPTEHLDPALARRILAGLLSTGPDALLAPDSTVVVVTHQVDLLPPGTRVLALGRAG